MKIELPSLLLKTLFQENKMFKLSTSSLYNQTTFYCKFMKDLGHAKSRVVIESPFITERRMTTLLPIMSKLRKRGVTIIVNTKPFDEHEQGYRAQAIWAVGVMQDLGIDVLMTDGHHRKLAIIDNDIIYEGSLNILSQNDSCELMRRIQDEAAVKETLRFIGLKKWCK